MSLFQNGQPCFSILCSHLVDFCQSGPPGVSTDRVETLAAVDVGPTFNRHEPMAAYLCWKRLSRYALRRRCIRKYIVSRRP